MLEQYPYDLGLQQFLQFPVRHGSDKVRIELDRSAAAARRTFHPGVLLDFVSAYRLEEHRFPQKPALYDSPCPVAVHIS